jgi:hypothetical protein
MEGLNPNAPPPKETEVRITKWEYTDPVGVPHPDVVDIVITLASSGSQPLVNLEVEVAGEWQEGSLRRGAVPEWSRPTPVHRFPTVSVGAAGKQTLRVPIDLKARMDALAKVQSWPYGFRATITVRDRGSVQPVAQTRIELPIRRGD